MGARVIPVGNVASRHKLGIIVADNAKIIVCYWAQFTRELVGRYDVQGDKLLVYVSMKKNDEVKRHEYFRLVLRG